MAFVELNGWDTGMQFSASHFIPGHVKCGRLHGHVYGIRLRVHGSIGPDHMIMDFIVLKKWLRGIVERFDHRVLLPSENPDISISLVHEEAEVCAAGKRYIFPQDDIVLVPVTMCSAEKLAEHLLDLCINEIPFPPQVTMVELGVDEGRGQGGWSVRNMEGVKR